MKQTAEAQAKQFGYNNDFLGYFPMPGAANPSAHGLLVVNHEFTNEELMFPGIGRQDLRNVAFAKMTPELAAIEMAAHGGAVIEVRRDGGKWSVVAEFEIRPPHRCVDADGDHRSSGRSRAPADERRSNRQARARHAEQLRRRRHAVGHLAHLRRELPRLLLSASSTSSTRKRATTSATASPATG